ncbi:DUF5326 family protein [Streptomyces sp. BI20]|uniref:DUF5326 family protein n=1 Tax=Streptomyces sp. BI20 TaxID=3403460 RepID=UPI003C77FBF3
MDQIREVFAGLPWWVKWVAIPLVALFVFGGVITSILSTLVGIVFKVLLFVGLVAGLIWLVKRFGGGGKSSTDKW